MKIIVINCGSSSIKYQLFDMPSERVIAKGLVDKIGLKGSLIKHTKGKDKPVIIEGEILDHQQGVEFLLGIMISKEYGSIENISDIQAVGHRVVHGAEEFSGSVLINDKVIEALEKSSELAPLHNPPNLKGIYAMQQLLPDVNQVGVFDTAFHQTMPEHAYLYAIPYVLYEKYKIRRYGFHGTSHKFVSARACEILDVDISTKKIITCHLGNGSSLAAIKHGKSYDTSMGMTPTEYRTS
jgi:acetate kinase